MSGAIRAALAVLLAAALASLGGCAATQPSGAAKPAQPPVATRTAQPAKPAVANDGGHAAVHGGTVPKSSRSGVPVGSTSSGGSILSHSTMPTVVDSGPSSDALAVLASIPEPLSEADRVPAPASATRSSATPSKTGSASSRAGSGTAAGVTGGAASIVGGTEAAARALAGSDSAQTVSRAEGVEGGAEKIVAGATAAAAALAAGDSAAADSEDIPVPAPTEPLGEKPGTLAAALADTTPPPPPPPPMPAPAAAKPDSCWRIQVAAPTDESEAELKRKAAESVLLMPFVIDHEKTRYKVRNRDCMSREAAAQLRKRAVDSGFDGAFPVLETKGKGGKPEKTQ